MDVNKIETVEITDNKKTGTDDILTSVPAEISELDLYQKREKIYTRKIEGFFQRIRMYTGWPILIAYFYFPWVLWKDRQAILFDLPERKFYIFDFIFWPQDFALLAWLLAIAAFSLFFVTSLFGRVWCGYTCPQTVWTSIFMWIEQKTEGSRNQRIKLDKAPLSLKKLLKKSTKHALWLLVSLLTGFTFVAYFVPASDLGYSFFSGQFHLWPTFWVLFFTFGTYFNAGWLREQVCMYMCPYARFQSAMYDENTLIVSYDRERGEPRGSRKRAHNSPSKKLETVTEGSEKDLGSCIDCKLCVQVCPTGIDIRDGLQYQCISCALCIDACNSIMEKMNYQPNLISYTTENKLNGNKIPFIRLKTLGYAGAIMILTVLFMYTVFSRVPLQIDVIRDRQQLYKEVANEKIENSYLLKIINKDENDHSYSISTLDNKNVSLQIGKTGIKQNTDNILVKSGEVYLLPVKAIIAKENIDTTGNKEITFIVTSNSNNSVKAQRESRIIGPVNLGPVNLAPVNLGPKDLSR